MKATNRFVYTLACASLLSLVSLTTGSVMPAVSVKAATSAINQYIDQHQLTYSGVTYQTSTFTDDFAYENGAPEGIVIHETADPDASAADEASYFRHNWQSIYSYVHAFVDHRGVIQIHPTNRGVWGAGPIANAKFIQVELCEESTYANFAQSVQNDATYVANLLHQYHLTPVLADGSGSGTIWSHNAVTTYLGGTDHTDPVGYFAKWGYSMSQFFDLVKARYDGISQTPSSSTDKGAGTVINTGSPVAHVEYQGNIVVWGTPGAQPTTKYLPYGSNWAVNGKMQLNGAWWYKLGTNQWVPGKYVSVTGFANMKTLTASTSQPSTAAGDIVQTGSPIAKVATSSATVYQQPNGSATGQVLSQGSRWQLLGKAQVNGAWWYKLGANQWVAGQQVSVTGFAQVPTVAWSKTAVVAYRGIGRVSYLPGYGVMIWRKPGQGALNRYLPDGTRWQVYQKATINGHVWYNLGGTQWLDGQYLRVTPS